MGRIVYFTGGARSGKSAHSEQYILDRHYDHKIYLATAVVFDEEMKERVKLHVERRGKEWDTLEGYRNLYNLVKSSMKEATRGVILLDCITNMVSNVLLEEKEDWENCGRANKLVAEEAQESYFIVSGTKLRLK